VPIYPYIQFDVPLWAVSFNLWQINNVICAHACLFECLYWYAP